MTGQSQVQGATESYEFSVPGVPVEVHVHGMGAVDFSDFDTLDLAALNAVAEAERVACIPTVYIARSQLDSFHDFMLRYHKARSEGLLPFVPRVAMEGPLLASHGGTPAATVFPPTRQEWELIASGGELGLAYVVLSPDALTPASELHADLTPSHPDLPWIIRTLVEAGVRPALGHFTKADPQRSADLVESIADTAWEAGWPGDGSRVITDHLFNDMPLKIRHAFRTRRARAARDATIAGYDVGSWTLDNLTDRIGPVPAAIMRLCHDGRATGCVNFDGEHVDLAIAKRAVEIVGADGIMLMTDRCDSARLGGQHLHHGPENTLWYQDDGVVAAGSQPLDRQLMNARRVGLPEEAVWQLGGGTAYAAFGLASDPWLGQVSSHVRLDPDGTGRHRRSLVPVGAGRNPRDEQKR